MIFGICFHRFFHFSHFFSLVPPPQKKNDTPWCLLWSPYPKENDRHVFVWPTNAFLSVPSRMSLTTRRVMLSEWVNGVKLSTLPKEVPMGCHGPWMVPVKNFFGGMMVDGCWCLVQQQIFVENKKGVVVLPQARIYEIGINVRSTRRWFAIQFLHQVFSPTRLRKTLLWLFLSGSWKIVRKPFKPAAVASTKLFFKTSCLCFAAIWKRKFPNKGPAGSCIDPDLTCSDLVSGWN